MNTARLLLRHFRESDLAPFAELNADPRVREFFPDLLTREKSDAFAKRIETHREEYGFSWYAVEVPGVTDFAGALGLFVPTFQTHFTPCVEIGWRLAFEHQGKGYATEGAKAVLDHAFSALKLKEVYSWTVPANMKSWRVMEKIGMKRIEEFDHPNVPAGSPLKKHVLYKGVGSEV
jgi:RimJ/RimL family protein N-acetyltransferase